MGNLMCCSRKTEKKQQITNSSNACDKILDHTQPQRDLNTEKAPKYSATNENATTFLSSKKFPYIENVGPIQGYERARTGSTRTNELQPKPNLRSPQQISRKALKSPKCNACGKMDHLTESCRYFIRLCFHCREEGHIARICPKLKRTNKSAPKRKAKLNHVKQKHNKSVKR